MPPDAVARFTIDELAQRSGMTVRNIRAHQSRGLLAPPVVEGRTGYYDEGHQARIELIRQLQADGYSLDLIGRMLGHSQHTSADALRFTRALREPFAEEEPQVVDLDELAERYGSTDPKLLSKAQDLGLIRPIGNGKWEEMSPSLGRAGAELTRVGIPPDKTLKVIARVRRNSESAARTFVRLFLEEVWSPFQREGAPEERWPEVSDALERLRPLASDSVVAIFAMAMDEEVEQAFGRELRKLRRDAKRGR
ncbi:MAG: MerR family transcriptional regulator [Thermoleophilaceae bacterium]